MFQPFEKSSSILSDLPELLAALNALADKDDIATLANASSLLDWYLTDINWVGFYLWKSEDEAMILGPFQGLPACIRIKSGQGVCGTAIESGEVQLVDDVLAFPGHIACDAESRSELVVPLYRRDGELIGVLDIDSPAPGRFTQNDAEAMKLFCHRLAELI